MKSNKIALVIASAILASACSEGMVLGEEDSSLMGDSAQVADSSPRDSSPAETDASSSSDGQMTQEEDVVFEDSSADSGSDAADVSPRMENVIYRSGESTLRFSVSDVTGVACYFTLDVCPTNNQCSEQYFFQYCPSQMNVEIFSGMGTSFVRLTLNSSQFHCEMNYSQPRSCVNDTGTPGVYSGSISINADLSMLRRGVDLDGGTMHNIKINFRAMNMGMSNFTQVVRPVRFEM